MQEVKWSMRFISLFWAALDPPKVADDEMLVKFFGGPFDGQWRPVPKDAEVIAVDPGEYHLTGIGIEGMDGRGQWENVFVWSGMHDGEVLDAMLGRDWS